MKPLSELTNEELLALAQQAPTPVEGVQVNAPSLANAPMTTAGGDIGLLSNEQLMAMGANTNPNMSTIEDMGRSAVTGLQHGATGLLGLPGDALSGFNKGVDWAAGKVGIPGKAMSDEESRTIFPGLTLPHASDLETLRQKFAGPDHEPQTTAGKYAGAIAGMVPASLGGPGGMGAKLALAVTSGAGSQGAGDLAHEAGATPGWEAAARAGGGLAGGLAAGAGRALTASPQRLVGEALDGVTPAQTQAAVALMRDAQSRGVQLTMAEAVQQVTGGGTGMGRMQRVIEGTKRGGQAFAPAIAERPTQVRGAAMKYADTIAPPTSEPGMVGARAKGAASGGLESVRKRINAAAEPDYAASASHLIPDAEYATLAANPSYAQTLKALRSDPELGAPLTGMPDNSIAVVDAVKKQLATRADQAAGTPMAPGDNYLASLRTDARGQAEAAARNASPEYGRAVDTVASGHEQFLDPLKAGPSGVISKTDRIPQQTGALYPNAPAEGASSETAQAMRLMGTQDSAIPADLTRQHLVNTLNKATQDLQGGANAYGGAKYAAAIAGNPEQAATLRAGVGASGGDTAQLDQMLEVLRATGKRQAAGSMTAFNEKDLEGLSGIPTPSKSGIDPIKAVGHAVSAFQQRRNVDALAKALLSNPDEAEAFIRQAIAHGPSRGMGLSSALLAGTAARGGP